MFFPLFLQWPKNSLGCCTHYITFSDIFQAPNSPKFDMIFHFHFVQFSQIEVSRIISGKRFEKKFTLSPLTIS